MERIVLKSIVLLALVVSYSWLSSVKEFQAQPEKVATALQQLDGNAALTAQIVSDHAWRNQAHIVGWLVIGVIGMIMFSTEIRKLGAP